MVDKFVSNHPPTPSRTINRPSHHTGRVLGQYTADSQFEATNHCEPEGTLYPPSEQEFESPYVDGAQKHQNRGRPSNRQRDNGRGQYRRKSPPPPKMATFHGKPEDDWVAFLVQFNRIASAYDWTEDEKLDKLIECLRGKSVSFYGRLQVRDDDRDDFNLLKQRLNDRYSHHDPPHTLRQQLHTIRQTVDEDLESYAERIQQMAYEAYPEALSRTIEDACIDSFLRGCKEKRAALNAMDKNPVTLQSAISQVKGAIHNRKALYGASNSLRQVTFADHEGMDEGVAIRKVEASSLIDSKPLPMDQLSTVVAQLAKVVASLQNRSRSPSPRPRSRSPAESRCFNCSTIGHFNRDCPEKNTILSN